MASNFIASIKESRLGIALIALASLLASFGQLFWKLSHSATDNWTFIFRVGIGLFLYGLGALLMIVAMRFGKLSVIHPAMCLSYVFIALIGVFFLGEICTWQQYLSMLVIISGVILIGGGSHD